MLKIIVYSVKYRSAEYITGLVGCVCFPFCGLTVSMSALRQSRAMEGIVFLSAISIYTEITLGCSDTNHSRTDHIRLPCWGAQSVSHSWRTSVPASLRCFSLPSTRTGVLCHLPLCSHVCVHAEEMPGRVCWNQRHGLHVALSILPSSLCTSRSPQRNRTGFLTFLCAMDAYASHAKPGTLCSEIQCQIHQIKHMEWQNKPVILKCRYQNIIKFLYCNICAQNSLH